MTDAPKPDYPRPPGERVTLAINQAYLVAEFIAPEILVFSDVWVRALLARSCTVAEALWALHELALQGGILVKTWEDVRRQPRMVIGEDSPPAGLEIAHGKLHVNNAWGNTLFIADHARLSELRAASSGKSAPDENTRKLFPKGIPQSANIVDLVVRLNAESGGGRSQNAIAREFTQGDEKKAKSLLAQIRRLKTEGRVDF